MANIRRFTSAALTVGVVAISVPALAESPNQQAESPYGYKLNDNSVYIHGVLSQMEGRLNGQNAYFRWDGQAWAGTDENKIWFKTEGRKYAGRTEDGDQELLYDRPISRFFDVQAGGRYDLDSRPGRGWAAFGVEGYAPEFINVEATVYASDQGHYAARLIASYNLFVTQFLVAQPQIEMNFYTKRDPARLVGAGLSDIDAGFRLRYEIGRKFAPYVGVTDYQQFGGTAVLARQHGEHPRDLRFVVGIRDMVLKRHLTPLLALLTFATITSAHAGQNGAKPSGEGHGMPNLANAPKNDRRHLQINALMDRCARQQQQMQQNQHIAGSTPAVAARCRKLDKMMNSHHEYELTQPQ
ncbi:MAG: hypothetical protein B7X49_10780 [Acidiphilium sp. 34-64-41]|nr:MAG: hypothetical protein B7X49_10780 [Acidiphilium sp. 34-64-41]